MCIKINLKQTVLARLFFFVIYDVKIPFMHLTWGEEGLTLLSLSVSFLQGLRRFLWEDSNVLGYIPLLYGDMEPALIASGGR